MDKKPMKIYVVIRGGMLETVFTDSDNACVVLLDFDNNGEHTSEEMKNLEQVYEEIKTTYCGHEYLEACEVDIGD